MAWFPQHLTPTIDRTIPSISQLMQVSWIDQSSHELGPQSIYSSSCVWVSPGVSHEICRFVTGAEGFLIWRWSWSHQATFLRCFQMTHVCMKEREKERKEGGSKEREKASKKARITFHWHSWRAGISASLTELYFLKLYGVHATPTDTSSLWISSSRWRG